MNAGINTLQMVILAIATGTTTPKNATNFLNPLLCEKAFFQTTNTKVLIHSWRDPAIRLEPTKIWVKFAIKKKESPVRPETAIHFEFLSMKSFLSG